MDDISKIYADNIWGRYKYYATWLPNSKMKLGDIGIMNKRKFERDTTLGKKGISFEIRQGTSPLSFDTSAFATITAGVGASASGPPGEVSIKVGFTKKGAFVFQANDCYVKEIEDIFQLESDIASLTQKNEIWKKEWVVIVSLVDAGVTTSLISETDSAEVEIKGKSSLNVPNLSNIGGGCQFSIDKGSVSKVAAEKGLTPLFKIYRIRGSFWEKLEELWDDRFLDAPPLKYQRGEVLEEVRPQFD